MTRNQIIAEVASRVFDADVAELSVTYDCSMLEARAMLEAEIFSEVTGKPLDYYVDWMERI